MSMILLQVIIQGLMVGMMYALIALGSTLVFSVSGLFNFAHGSFLAVAMYGALSIYTALALDPYVSIVIMVPAMFILGWLFFRFIIQRMLNVEVMMAAQVTVGMIWIIEAIQTTVYTNDVRSVPSFLGSSKVHIGSLVMTSPYIVAFVAALVVGIALYIGYQKTDFGRQIRALMQNRAAAALMGIRVRQTQTIVFAIGMAILGIAGPLVAPMIPMTPSAGLNFTLLAFFIMMLGGAGNFLGVVVGGLIYGVADSLARFYLTGNVASLVPYFILIVVLLFRPQGLLGEKI